MCFMPSVLTIHKSRRSQHMMQERGWKQSLRDNPQPESLEAKWHIHAYIHTYFASRYIHTYIHTYMHTFIDACIGGGVLVSQKRP